MTRTIIASTLLLAACAHPEVPPPAVVTKTLVRTVEVQKPCAVTIPKRPSALTSFPTDAVQLAATIAAKLAEWSGPGGYGERADAALRRCATP